jgi:hypothetical protein
VSVLPENSLHKNPKVGAIILPSGPVDCHIPAHGIHKFTSDRFQDGVAWRLDGTVVHFQSIVERNFILRKPKFRALC